MPEHVLISCNQCRRGLRVRVNYLGQSVGCNHCGHLFVAEERADLKAGATSMAPSASVRHSRIDSAETPIMSTAQGFELKQLRADRIRLKAENDHLASKLATASYQRLSLQLRVGDLESQLHRAHEHIQLLLDELTACERARSELNRLRIESVTLREKATHALELEDELQTLQQHAEARRVEHEELLARANRERDQAVRQLEIALGRSTEGKLNDDSVRNELNRAADREGIRDGTHPVRPAVEPLVE